MAESPETFAQLLRELRLRARLTQEELAEAAGVSLRTVSDLERGFAATPQRETVRLLADALHLIGPERGRFETVARGRPVAGGFAAAAAMRSLPRDVATFTGRERELERLVEAAAATGGVVGIHAIGGMAGVGKTAFAVHAAHKLADRFPAGQIFLLLHGHTPGQQPVEPNDALASLLLTIGVAAAQIPPELEARIALWRDRLAGRQLLLILDDAASSDQVLPLLPGAGGSLVLVTSRRHMTALDDATTVSLDTLPPAEAAALLIRLAGRSGLSQSDPGVRDLIRLCGYLPLAIGMVGRQLRHHPAWTAAGRAAELAAAVDRLELMETENLSVAAAFDLSYAQLTEDRQRLFRRLGLHPGSELDSYATAALDGTGLMAARRSLEDLYEQYLLTEPAHGRYRLHDLLREHARALAARDDSDEDRDQATARLLDYYQHAATRANALIVRQSRSIPATATGGVPPAVPALADRKQALAWARAERASLLACLDHAAGTGQHTRVVALTSGLGGLLHRDGPWTDAITLHAAALEAARQLGDRLGQANARYELGIMRQMTSDFPGAVGDFDAALGLYRDLGDSLGEANSLHYLGSVRSRTGDFEAATRGLADALVIYRDLGDRQGQANALNYLGDIARSTGDYAGAARHLEEALGIYRSLGDSIGEASMLMYLGVVGRTTGDYPAAARAVEQALGIHRDLGDRHGQANCLICLVMIRRSTGDFPGAARAGEEALDVYRDIGDRLGQANALMELGAVRQATADFTAAALALDEALSTYRDLGNQAGEAEALNNRGALHRVTGELAQAQGLHQQALELARVIGTPWDEAHALAGLGRCALSAGQDAHAETLMRQALEIFQRTGAADAAEVAAELETLAAAPDQAAGGP
jgi:tetratricopeptide (TPR) repeat protein/transcriptional regulator with XRE-family HTH domain